MKVRVVLSLDVDPEAWAAEYGCEVDEVRQDVRSYVAAAVDDSPAGMALLIERDPGVER